MRGRMTLKGQASAPKFRFPRGNNHRMDAERAVNLLRSRLRELEGLRVGPTWRDRARRSVCGGAGQRGAIWRWGVAVTEKQSQIIRLFLGIAMILAALYVSNLLSVLLLLLGAVFAYSALDRDLRAFSAVGLFKLERFERRATNVLLTEHGRSKAS